MYRITFAVALCIVSFVSVRPANADLVTLEGLPYMYHYGFDMYLTSESIAVFYQTGDSMICAEFFHNGAVRRSPYLIAALLPDADGSVAQLVVTPSGWVAILSDKQRDSSNDFQRNRTRLVFRDDDSVHLTLLDSGATHQELRNDSLHQNQSFSLISRANGSYFASWIRAGWHYGPFGAWWPDYKRVLAYFWNLTSLPTFSELSCVESSPQYGALYADPGDSDGVVLLNFETDRDSTNIYVCRADAAATEFVAEWPTCISQFRHSTMLLDQYTISFVNGPSPLFTVTELDVEGECHVVVADTLVYDLIVSNPHIGIAALERTVSGFSITRFDTHGNLLAAETPFFDTQEDVYLHAGEFGDDGMVLLYAVQNGHVKIAVTPWDAISNARINTPVVPQELSLAAYPNPFNSTVTIRYDLPQAGDVSLAVFDIQGRQVSTLRDEFTRAGSGELLWSPEHLASGVYFVSLESSFAHKTQKILYLK